MSESINHNGIIEKIDGNAVFVRIIQQSACSGCHAQSMCSASEKKEKIIEVNDNNPGRFHVNEEVTLCGQSSLGLQAVFLAFVLPLILLSDSNWYGILMLLPALITVVHALYARFRNQKPAQ